MDGHSYRFVIWLWMSLLVRHNSVCLCRIHFLLLWSIRICSPQLAASYSVWAVSRGHAGLTNTRTHEGVKESNIFIPMHTHTPTATTHANTIMVSLYWQKNIWTCERNTCISQYLQTHNDTNINTHTHTHTHTLSLTQSITHTQT